MKRTYRAMEAYKVSFNANEQVAAACNAVEEASKYNMPAAGGLVCDTSGGKYGGEGWGTCVGDESAIAINLQYAS